jgi:MFS family permease
MSSTEPNNLLASHAKIPSYKPWLVWGLGCLFYFYEFLLQVSPGVMSNELMRDFNVTSQTLGLLVGFYFYAYAFMQLPCGMLLDYFGPHRILTLATAICAFSTIAFGMTESFVTACIARTMIGFGSAFAAVGTLKLAANWFPPNRFAFLTGLMITIGMLGAISGEAPLASLIGTFGWRESMLIMGIVGLVLALLILTIAKDYPNDHLVEKDLPKKTTETKVFASLVALFKNKQLWLIATYGGLMFLSTPVFCGLWGVPFLMDKMGVSKPIAANFVSLIFVGWAIAAPLWGVYSTRIGKRKPSLYMGAIGAFITSVIFIYLPFSSGWVIGISLFVFGIFSAGFLPAFAVAKEICDKRYVATGLSFMNMMNQIGIAIIQPVIGYILDRMWAGTMVGSVRFYPLHAYQTALALLPVAILIALLILPFIKETYCHNVEN